MSYFTHNFFQTSVVRVQKSTLYSVIDSCISVAAARPCPVNILPFSLALSLSLHLSCFIVYFPPRQVCRSRWRTTATGRWLADDRFANGYRSFENVYARTRGD